MTPFHIPGSKVVKTTAKTALTGRKTEAAIVSLFGVFSFLIMSLLTSVISANEGKLFEIFSYVVSVLFSVFVIAPLMLGIIRFFWRMTDGVNDNISSVFYYFGSQKQYLRAFKLTLVMFFRVVTVLFVCLLPFAIVSLISGTQLYGLLGFEIPLWAPNLILIRSFLYILGVWAAILIVSRYYLVPVLVVMDEELLLLEAVHISSMVSKKSLSSFISLLVSLIVWIVLSVLLIPAIYTLPFVFVCYVVHCRFAITNYNLLIENFENDMSGYYYEKE